MTSIEDDISWFAPHGTPLRAELNRLQALAEKVRGCSGGSYIHTSILQQQRNQARGFKPTVVVSSHLKMPPLARIELHELCSVSSLFQQFVVRSYIAVSAQLDAVLLLLTKGNVLPALLCLRGVIEHAAIANYTLRNECLRLPLNKDVEALTNALVEARAFLTKNTFGTKIGLKEFVLNPEPFRRRKELKYTPEGGRVDLTAPTIMKHIDKLGKQIKGLRAIYNVLSEFAHPNFGTQFAFTEEVSPNPIIDEYGVIWKSTKIGLGKPISFARVFERQIAEIIGCVAECVEGMIVLLEECTITSDNLMSATQIIARQQIAANRGVFTPYEICPCRSGKKLKFCCGR